MGIDTFAPISTPRAPAVVLSFDDGYESLYSVAFQYMQSCGLVGTAYVCTGNIGDAGYVTLEQLQEMYAAGWDICNHTNTHTRFVTGGLTQQQIEDDLTAAKNILDAAGMDRVSNHCAYPGGERSATSDAALANIGFLTGRTTNNYPYYIPLIASLYSLNCNAVPIGYSLSEVSAWIDTTISTECVMSICFHKLLASPVSGTDWSIDDFRSFINYLVASPVRKLTISQFYAARIAGTW